MATGYTDLVIAGIGIPTYAVRGVRQSTTLIDQASRITRSVNGKAIDVSNPAMRKYRTVISGSDQETPAFGGVWPGRLVSVTSLTTWDSSGTGATGGGTAPTGASGATAGTAVNITGLVKSFEVTTDEWAATVDWTLEIEQL